MMFKSIFFSAGTAAMIMCGTPAIAGQDHQTDPVFKVVSTTNGLVRLSVKAYDEGEYERSIAFSERALTSGLSQKRKAIAQSNLCAAYAANNQIEEALSACNLALKIRPDYKPALENKEALTRYLAKNDAVRP